MAFSINPNFDRAIRVTGTVISPLLVLVLDGSGDPVTGLTGTDFGTITVLEEDGTSTAITTGNYTVAEHGLGWYLLSTLTITAGATGRTILDIQPDAAAFEPTQVVGAIAFGGTIYLQDVVRDFQGTAVIGATVTIFETGTATQLAQTTTDNNGRWRVDIALLVSVTVVDVEVTGQGFALVKTEGVVVPTA